MKMLLFLERDLQGLQCSKAKQGTQSRSSSNTLLDVHIGAEA